MQNIIKKTLLPLNLLLLSCSFTLPAFSQKVNWDSISEIRTTVFEDYIDAENKIAIKKVQVVYTDNHDSLLSIDQIYIDSNLFINIHYSEIDGHTIKKIETLSSYSVISFPENNSLDTTGKVICLQLQNDQLSIEFDISESIDSKEKNISKSSVLNLQKINEGLIINTCSHQGSSIIIKRIQVY